MRDPLPLRHSVPTPPPGIVVEPSPIRGLAADTSIRRIFGHSHFGLFHPYAVALRHKNSILMEAGAFQPAAVPAIQQGLPPYVAIGARHSIQATKEIVSPGSASTVVSVFTMLARSVTFFVGA